MVKKLCQNLLNSKAKDLKQLVIKIAVYGEKTLVTCVLEQKG